MGRIILAGIIGGIVMFVWSFVVHTVLHLPKEMGPQQIQNEDAVVAALKQSIPGSGVYAFPWMDMSQDMTPEQEKAWTDRYQAGPNGLLVYRSVGDEPMAPKKLVIEGVADVLAAIVAASILTMMACTFAGRVAGAFAIGVIAWLCISVSNWNWWGFTFGYIGGEAIDIVGGWLIAGIVMAMMIGKARRAAA
jgi:hypothetical protein